MEIRSATIDDLDAVTTLLEELGRPRVTDATRAACEHIFRRQLDDPDAEHLVAVAGDGTVAGFCSLHYRERLNHATPEAWIPDLIVTEAARRRGLARALLEEARRRAADRGCWSLTLESAHHRSAAHALYAAFGMRDTGKAFDLDLS